MREPHGMASMLVDAPESEASDMTLGELLRLAGHAGRVGDDAGAAADPVVNGLTHDSRQVRRGNVFVAVRGQRDGAGFAAEAVRRGAVAVVAASPDRRVGVPWIVVDDDRAALADLACAVHGFPSTRMHVTGVTGTNGKTTTVSMVHGILEAAGRPSGLLGTLEARWPGNVRPATRTTPEASDIQAMLADMLRDGCGSAVLEVSSHAVDLQRVRGVRFSAVAFTNLSQDHLDWHGDMERYFQSKARLFTQLAPDATAVICADDQHGARLGEALRRQSPRRGVTTCGFSSAADLRVEAFRPSSRGCTFTLRGRVNGDARTVAVDEAVALELIGRHAAANACVAAGVALGMGVGAADVVAALAAFRGVPGRLELVAPDEGHDDGVTVFVDYAHTPAALEVALAAARESAGSRVICVFGCGGDRDPGKRAPMGEAVARLADVAIATSDNPRSEDPDAILAAVSEGLRRGRAQAHVVRDRREAIALALDMARNGDVLVVAGKGHETYQEVAGRKLDFDDRQVVRELRRERSARAKR